ncbi:MFS family permease [Halarchaeum rubridurum]|uniref:MFS family permease n=1 Tax=Halarchaeum rubridurum TaxID=489911 RepID=A0A830FWC9_9EURY|nr:MFS transporter [Halarchaeum rubridurum]MBP1953166.1 MFS family permease [Halarchaeum rubridurum]GGM67377.1 tetracycline resistance MFS efflux pump [Halarchaeum rubridurum]
MSAPEAAAASVETDAGADAGADASDAVRGDDEPGGGTNGVEQPRRALATVLAIVFIDLLGFGIIVPILPYYVRSFGVSDVYIGLLAASYSLLQFVFAPLLGRLSDEHGRRPVLMLSVAGSAIAWTLFGLGAEFEALFGVAGGVGTLFVARMVAGAMGGNVATAQAYVADVTTRENRAGALGLIGAAFGLGFVFGPALGGLLASDPVVAAARDGFPAFVPATRFSLPSFAAAGLAVLACAATYAFLPEPSRHRTASAERTGVVAGFLDAARSPTLRPYVLTFLLVSVAFSGMQVVFVPFAADTFGYGEAETALLLTYIGVLGVVNQAVVVGRLSRRYRDDALAVVGALALVASLAVVPFTPALGAALVPPSLLAGAPAWLTPALVALLVDLALLSVGNGLLNVALTTLVSAAAPADEQGAAFGVTQSAGSLGRTVGPPAMTALYVLAPWPPFVLGAVLAVGVVAVLVGTVYGHSRDAGDAAGPEG